MRISTLSWQEPRKKKFFRYCELLDQPGRSPASLWVVGSLAVTGDVSVSARALDHPAPQTCPSRPQQLSCSTTSIWTTSWFPATAITSELYKV